MLVKKMYNNENYSTSFVEIICQDPEDIQFGNKQIFRRNYDEDYVTVGDKVEYNCFPGYKMKGSKQLFCTKNGKWNGSKPICTGKYLKT